MTTSDGPGFISEAIRAQIRSVPARRAATHSP
jgi:hypothetical protein